jgi:hypothetical protein
VDLGDSGVAMPSSIYVKADSAASRAAPVAAVRSQLGGVLPVSSWSAVVSDQQAAQNRAGLELLLGIVAVAGGTGFAPITLPWALTGAISAGCLIIAVTASAVPGWIQFHDRN